MAYLAGRGEPWSEVFNNNQRMLVAVNQEISRTGTLIKDNDEVAFMPPVTGG
jgi:molybdopterin synthase sulfur carrier subunit